MQEMEAGVNERGKTTAKFVLTQADKLPNKLRWKLSKFQNKYYESLIDKYIALKTEGFNLAPTTPNLEDVFVPLKVASESYRNISGGITAKNQPDTQQGNEIWHFLTPNSQQRCIAILAPSGSGKTTLLQYITLTYARKAYRKYKAPNLIPVLLRLRDVREMLIKPEPPSLNELIQEQIKLLPLLAKVNLPTDWFENRLNNGMCLVMLDGLDEVANDSERSTVSRWVTQQMGKYPKSTFILTSRRHGYESESEILGEKVNTVLEVQPFTLAQMKQFIQGWYLQTKIQKQGRKSLTVQQEAQQEADELIEALLQNPTIRKMASNPLLVTMIATVHYLDYTLPGKRVELYKEICDVLLGRRPSVKRIRLPLNAQQNQSIFQLIALNLMQRGTQKFTLEAGKLLIKDKLEQEAGNTLTPEKWLETIKNDVGLLVEKEQGSYEFAHLSFQEYLAAVQVEKLKQENILIQNFHVTQWAETIYLYAGLSDVNNITRLILEALQRWQKYGQEEVKSLTLAYSCLQENPNKVEKETKNKLTKILEEGLESSDQKIAQIAAKVKLSSRLNQLLDVDGRCFIDRNYITYAEYQLFLDDQLNSTKCFQSGNAKHIITGISYQNALEFCTWLSVNAPLLIRNEDENKAAYYYRLPTATEVKEHPARERLECWTIGASDISSTKKGIRIVRALVPNDFSKLVNYLAAAEWEKASQETELVIFKMARRERERELDIAAIESIDCQSLQTLEQLWLQYSQGRFGLGVQISIWGNVGGTPLGYLFRLWYSNSSANTKEILSALARKFAVCRIEKALPFLEFEVITVNAQGQETQRKNSQARYFTEDLGNSIALDMVAIPGGTFLMGSPENEKGSSDDERPQHQVSVRDCFMGKYPITQAQWKAVASLAKVERELKPDSSHFKGDNLPVEGVSWYDAIEFCKRLSKKTGREYRLPSEAEWEYTCRAGTTTPFHFGETITTELANYDGTNTYASAPKGQSLGKTTPIGSFPPNAFGLYDMHGNVWEWCADHWHDSYKGAPNNGLSWLISGSSNDNHYRLLRGGSWDYSPGYCRSAYRGRGNPDIDYDDIGFRVVCGGTARTY
ncbi:SUMF1/EgtB/PvdO family nonheme iron enzyme [Nostoc sp. MG11]|uniref:SUMF1/EgtB/PvdO family nonheme iron enzyme n=1 Tax=Nostoc sp. MG11 TaxID=2721166 RepID=UPI001867313C|nr:SUMF1/EgtB/PvdO family nonheme iron enzyme [Nostoc sp. MG11]